MTGVQTCALPICKLKGRIRINLPSIYLSNANRLYNKLDELEALVSTKQLENCCTLVLTETWLNHKFSDSQLSLPGYSLLRADRDNRSTQKSIGGGLSIYINDKWANSFKILSTRSDPELETMVVKVRPFWLPRDITSIIFIVIYCPIFSAASTQKVKDVVARLHDTIEETERLNPDAAIIALGDFNSASIKLRRYKQHVTSPTRNKIGRASCRERV